ncbi:hypothetical protein OG474_20420 [Kribbella sp. NBC_01505]|uniref:WXG100-like domain-containing protein n=1 Tax=Kribbella sp. NBC_01505 TaxID=2903580 RepID=UPI00386F2089
MIPEPTTSMWLDLRKAIDSFFPIWIDENAAARMGERWNAAAARLEATTKAATAINERLPAAWPDSAGAEVFLKVSRTFNAPGIGTTELVKAMRELSLMAKQYSDSIAQVKNQINAELAANGAAFVASFAMGPLGVQYRNEIIAAAMARIAQVVRAGADLMRAFKPPLLRAIVVEMMEEPGIELTGQIMDIVGNHRQSIDWRQVGITSLAGGAGALLNVAVTPVARWVSRPVQAIAPPSMRKNVGNYTTTFLSNGFTSPVSSTFVQNVADGKNPFVLEDYRKALMEQGLGAGGLAGMRVGAHDAGHVVGDWAAGKLAPKPDPSTPPMGPPDGGGPIGPIGPPPSGGPVLSPSGAEATAAAQQAAPAPAADSGSSPAAQSAPDVVGAGRVSGAAGTNSSTSQQDVLAPQASVAELGSNAVPPGSVVTPVQPAATSVPTNSVLGPPGTASNGPGPAGQPVVPDAGHSAAQPTGQNGQTNAGQPNAGQGAPASTGQGAQASTGPNAQASTGQGAQASNGPNAQGPAQGAQPAGQPAAGQGNQTTGQGPVQGSQGSGPTGQGNAGQVGPGNTNGTTHGQQGAVPTGNGSERVGKPGTSEESKPAADGLFRVDGPPDGPLTPQDLAPINAPPVRELVVHAPEGPGYVRGQGKVEAAPEHADALAAAEGAKKEHFGGLLTADPVVVGDHVVVQAKDGKTYRFALELEKVEGKHAAQTTVAQDGGPQKTRIDPQVKPWQWTRTWVHEIGHAVREAMRAEAGEQAHEHTEDLCIEAEHDVRRLVAEQAAEARAAAERSGLPEDRALAEQREQELAQLDEWIAARTEAHQELVGTQDIAQVEVPVDRPAGRNEVATDGQVGLLQLLNDRSENGKLSLLAKVMREHYYHRPRTGKHLGQVRLQTRPGRETFPVRTSDGTVVQVAVPQVSMDAQGNFVLKDVRVVPGKVLGKKILALFSSERFGFNAAELESMQSVAEMWNESATTTDTDPVEQWMTPNDHRVWQGLIEAERKAILADRPMVKSTDGKRSSIWGERVGEAFAESMLRWLRSDPNHLTQDVYRVFFQNNGGAGRMDQLYIRVDKATREIRGFVVVEAKGIFGRLVSRKGVDLVSYLQGHEEYLNSLLSEIRADVDGRAAEPVAVLDGFAVEKVEVPSHAEYDGPPRYSSRPVRAELATPIHTAADLIAAMQEQAEQGNLQYLVVKAKVEFAGGKIIAKGIEITEYDMSALKLGPVATRVDASAQPAAEAAQVSEENAAEPRGPETDGQGRVVHAPEGPGFVRGAVETAPNPAAVLEAAKRAKQEHFGGLLTADPVVTPDRVVVQANDGNTYEFALEVEAVEGKHAAQTQVSEDGTFTTRIDPGVKREQWTRAWVHEIGHAVREAMRARAGEQEHAHTEDLCIEAEQDVRRLVADQAAKAREAAEQSGLPEDHALAEQREQELAQLDEWLQARIDAHEAEVRSRPWSDSSESFQPAGFDGQGRRDRSQILRFGRNQGRIAVGEDGRVREARARLREDYNDGKRGGQGSSNRQAVTEEAGIPGDSGGHFLARRFFHNDEFYNLFAQNLTSNDLMLERMEEEWARLTKLGYEVDVIITPSPGRTRPDEVTITYTVVDPGVIDPATGQEKVVWQSGRTAVNAAGTRITVNPAGEMFFGFFEAQTLHEMETAGTTRLGANEVTRTVGPDGIVDKVVAVLRKVDPKRFPLSKQAVGKVLAARERLPLGPDGKVAGSRLFGPAGIAALLPAGTTIDPAEYARLEQEWIGHIAAGQGVTVEVSRPGTPGQHVELTFTVTASPAPYNSSEPQGPAPFRDRIGGERADWFGRPPDAPPTRVNAPSQPGMDRTSRPASQAPATQQDLNQAAQAAEESDFGGLITGSVQMFGDVVVVDTPNLGRRQFRLRLGDIPGKSVAHTDLSTDGSPNETTIERGLRTDQLTRAVVHEISHVLKEMANQKLRAEGQTGPFEDACLVAQVNEHRFLQRLLGVARVVAARTGSKADQQFVQKLEMELEGLRQSLENQGIHGPSQQTSDTTAWQEIDGGSVGTRQVRSFGENVVARPVGPVTTGESVIAELRKLIPDAVPAMMRAIAAAAGLGGVPLVNERPVGWSFFGTTGLAALGVTLDPAAFHTLETRLGALIAKGYTATLALTKLPSPSSTIEKFRYTVALTAPNGTVTMHSAIDLNTLAASLPFEIAAPVALSEAPVLAQPNRPGVVGRVAQWFTGQAVFNPGWFVLTDELQRAVLRGDVWVAAGIEAISRIANPIQDFGGNYRVKIAGTEEFRLTLSVGKTASELWAEASLVFESRGPVLALVLSDEMSPRDVAPVLARVIAETVAELASTAPAEGPKVFGPATQPRTNAVQNIEDVGDRAELRHRGEVMKTLRRIEFLKAALQRIDGTKLLTQMGLRDHQRSAELLRTLLDQSERDLAALLDTGKSLKDERASVLAYEAKALRGSGLTNTVIAVTTAIVTGNPLMGIGIFVPALTNALVGAVMERWLDGRKEVGRQPAYDADRAARDQRNPGLRGLLDDVVLGVRNGLDKKLPRATSMWNYTIRYGASSISTAAVIGVLEGHGVPAFASLVVIGASSLGKWLTEKLVDSLKLDYRLSRVDRSTEARMTDPNSLDNQVLRSFTELHDRVGRALEILTGQPQPSAPASTNPGPVEAKREMPPFWLHAVVQGVDGLSAAARRLVLATGEDVSDPTELSRALSGQIEALIGAFAPILPTGVLGAFGEMKFLNLEEAASDKQKNYDAEEREAAQGAKTVAELRPWHEILEQRVRVLEAMAGLAPDLGVRAGDRAGFPQAPQGPAGARPYGQRSPWIYAIPVVLASIGGVGGTLLLNWQLGLSGNSVAITIAGAVGAIAGTPFARSGFRRAELNRKDEVAAARAKQEADPRKLLEQRAMVRYLVTQLTLRAEVFLARTQDAPAVILPAITTRADQIKYAINQAVRELAGRPDNKPKLFERLVAMEQVLDTLEALEYHQQHGTPDSIALLEQELNGRLGAVDELWQEQGQQNGFPMPTLTPTRTAIQQALNPAPKPPGGPHYGREVRGTRHVRDGRPASEGVLDDSVVLDAVSGTNKEDFGGLLEAAPKRVGELVVARPGEADAQHFRVEVGKVRRGRMAATYLHSGTAADPHIVRIAPGVANDQLARVWVHEISHALHALHGHGVGSRVRQVLNRITGAVVDACIEAQINEHRFLARQWGAAKTEADRTGLPEDRAAEDLLRKDIEGLAKAIGRLGHTPPSAPWAGPTELAGVDLQQEANRLADQVTDLNAHRTDKESSATKAEKAARKAERQARAAGRYRDQGRFARVREKLAESVKQSDLASWHQQRAEAYQHAETQAARLQAMYERLLVATPDQLPQMMTELTALRTEYDQAMAALTPPQIALPNMMPTGALPHISSLAEQVNTELARLGVEYRFSAESLQNRLSAEFGQLVTPEGAVLRFGTAELRITLSVGELQEVLRPPVTSSEMMAGVMPQRGRRLGTAATSRFGLGIDQSLRELTRLLIAQIPTIAGVGEFITARVGTSGSRSLAVTGTAAEFAQDGAVEDNRGESLLYKGEGRWRIDVRTPETVRWRTVDADLRPGAIQGWVSHVYTVPAAKNTVTSGRQPHGRFPDALVSSITGLHELSDTVTTVFRGRLQRLGKVADNVRQQIQEAIAHDLVGRLAESTERVIIQPLLADGVPIGHVEITTTVRYEQTELVGAESATHWQERVRVGFTTVSGQAGYGTNVDGKGTLELGPAPDGSGSEFNGEASIGKAASRGEAQSVGGTAIQVGVHRYTGPTQGYRMVLEHKVVLVLGGRRFGAVSGNSEALVRLRLNDAFHHGLPVNAAALVRDDQGQVVVDSNGRPVVRGDVRPDSRTPEQLAELIPGRKLELPTWARPGAGVGPALVQDVTGGNEALAQIIGGLTERGYLPPLRSDGTIDMARLTKDPVERHGQILNLEELVAQLSTQRLEAGYDAAVQSGLLLTLTRPRTQMATETVTLRINLVQEADGARAVGITSDEAMVTLNIGSDSAGRFGSRSKAVPFSVKPVGVNDPTADDGSGGKAGFSWGRSAFGRTLGFLSGGTVNQVTLVESTSPLAVFELTHRLVVTEVGQDTETVLHEGPGTARVLLDSDLLPYSKEVFEASTTPGRVRQALLDRATVLALHSPDLLAALPAQLLRDPAARQLAAAFLNPRNLMAHPEWTDTPYRTGVIVQGHGPVSQRYTLGVTGFVRDAVLIGVTDGVSGDINLAMGNYGAVTGWSSSQTSSVSESAAVDDNPDNQAAPQGAGLAASIGSTTSASTVDQTIWGVERLTIEVGRHYVFAADADLSLNVTDAGRQVADHTNTGKLVFQIAERDALAFYAKGELALPLQQVADAVERYLNGSLTLDRRAATALIGAYRAALTNGPKPAKDSGLPRLWNRHGPARLLAKLGATVTDPLFPARTRLADLLAKFDVDGKDLPLIPVPAQYKHSLGSTLIESTELNGTVLDAVQGVLRSKLGVQFANDPAIAEAFFGDLAGKRWWGRIDDMLGPNGFARSFPVQRPGSLVPERVTVRIRAELDDHGVQLGDSKTTISIVQRYLYGDRSATRGRGQSLGGGVEGSLATGADPAAQTDRSESVSHSFGQQQTRLERMATFDGVTRLRRGLRLHIEVTHNPTAAPTSGRIRQAFQPTETDPGAVRTETAVLIGSLIQLVPSGYLKPRVTPAGPTGDTTPVEMPETYFVEAIGWQDGAQLLEAIRAGLADPELLGPGGARMRAAELENLLSPSALHAEFSQMASADGYRIPGVPAPGQASRVVDIVIRVVPSDPEMLTEAVPNSELGVVNRTQSTTSTTASRGRLLPASGRTTVPFPGIGTKPTVSVGEQLSDQTTDVRGVRFERSRFEGESMVTARLKVRYEVTLIPVQVLGFNPEQPDRPLWSRRLPWIPGEVYVTGHDHEIGVNP